MERWVGKVALITGANAGIGAAIAQELVQHGMKVVGFDKQVDNMKQMAENNKTAGELFPFEGDVSKTEQVEAVFAWIDEKFGAIHVLINNAGIGRSSTILEGNMEHFKEVINVNLLGMTACCQKAMQLMKKAGVDDGHIINMNSTSGHQIISLPVPTFNVYPASKHGVTALTECLRHELRYMKTKTKVTSITPGTVTTGFARSAQEATGAVQVISEELRQMFLALPRLQPKDVAEAVVYVIQTPPHVQIQQLTIKPVGEPF